MDLIKKENNLPARQSGNAVATWQNYGKVKAVEVRRDMVTMPVVVDKLNKVELKMFTASTQQLISEYPDHELLASAQKLFPFIAKDVGYNYKVDLQNWQYLQTRLITILKDYYANISLADIKLAFELAALGELDDFLPKDSKGNPDKNHYQQFNIDYFSKILNAYLERQKKAVNKAYAALPEPETKNPEQIAYYSNSVSYDFIMCFLRYKYFRVFIPNGFEVIMFYERLLKLGYAEPLNITEDDNRLAMERVVADALAGRINKFEAIHIRTQKENHEHVKTKAIGIAKRNALRASFDLLIEEGILITDLVKFL